MGSLRAILEGKGRRARYESFSFDNSGTSGDVVVAAAKAGHIHRIVHIMLVSSGTTNIQYYSTTTALSGPMALVANVGFVDHPGADTPLDTASGASFEINISANTQVFGYVLYYTETA